MIARKSFLIVTSQFFIRFLGWIGLVVLAKLWSDFAPDALGIIGFAISFLAIFNILADLGFSKAHIKRISEGKDLGTCIGTFATIKLLLLGLMITVVIISILIWKNIFHGGFSDATTESVIIVFVIYYIFTNLRLIATDTFVGRKEVAKRQITNLFEGVKTPLIILVALAGVSLIGVGISPAVKWPLFLQPLQQFLADHAVGSLAMTYVFAVMASFFVGMWFLRKYPIKRPSWNLFKSYLSFALPIMLFSVIGIISVNIDKIMIGYYWTSKEVGYYFTVQQILQLVMILYVAVSTVLFPTFSEYHSNKNFEEIGKIIRLAERYISMIIIPPIVLIIILVNPVINIMLSASFLPAAPVLILLAIFTLIYSLNVPYRTLIIGVNRPDIAAKLGVMICITNISLNYLFIPKRGLLSSFGISGPTGAAIATVISILAGFVGARIIVKKITGMKILQSHTPRHLIAGVFMSIVIYFLAFRTKFFPDIGWYHLLIFAGLGLGIYLVILFLLKEFKKHDLDFFLNILHPKEMTKYISSELKDDPKKPN
jgi:O-antigen/teichoic acid export membrane protein